MEEKGRSEENEEEELGVKNYGKMDSFYCKLSAVPLYIYIFPPYVISRSFQFYSSNL